MESHLHALNEDVDRLARRLADLERQAVEAREAGKEPSLALLELMSNVRAMYTLSIRAVVRVRDALRA